MQRILLILGVALVAAALAWPWLRRLPLGRLPGDILHRSGNTTFFFPITTMLLLSAVVSLLLWLFRR